MIDNLASGHGLCVCPAVPIDAPESLCERHNCLKNGSDRMACRTLKHMFYAGERQLPARSGRVGSALRHLLSELGINKSAGCGCDKRAAQMDAWGLDGCRQRRAEIVAWLNESAGKATWTQALSAGVAAAIVGMFVNPLSPGDGLFEEAIRRAEKALHNG